MHFYNSWLGITRKRTYVFPNSFKFYSVIYLGKKIYTQIIVHESITRSGLQKKCAQHLVGLPWGDSENKKGISHLVQPPIQQCYSTKNSPILSFTSMRLPSLYKKLGIFIYTLDKFFNILGKNKHNFLSENVLP